MPITYMAFDYGEKRIGVAIGNDILRQASELTTIYHRTVQDRFAQIEKLLTEWQPQILVVGLPLHPDGAPNEMTPRCKRFGNQLHGRFGKPVFWVDERYSSAVADKHGRSVDEQAAKMILQQFFDT